MYTDSDTNGLQFNIRYQFYDKKNMDHKVCIACGRSQDPGCDYSFLGPVYDLRYKWFFSEIGIGKRTKVRRSIFRNSPYFLIIQIGYSHRLNEY